MASVCDQWFSTVEATCRTFIRQLLRQVLIRSPFGPEAKSCDPFSSCSIQLYRLFFFFYRALHLLLLAWGFHEYCTVRSMVKLHVACSVSHYFMNYRWRLWQRNTSYSARVSLEIHWSLFQAILSSDLVRYQYFPSFSLSFNLTVWNWKPSSFIYELMWGKNQTCS